MDFRSTERGSWYTARGERGAEVSAYRRHTRDGESGPFTIFWQGHTALRHIQEFAAPYFRRGIQVRATILTSKRRLHFLVPYSFVLSLRVPANGRFLRLECRSPSEPATVIWARLGPFEPQPDGGRSDDIGVKLSSREFSEIGERLTQFVRRTHRPQAPAPAIGDCLELLGAHLGPGAQKPVYA
jgi:hypothetical protein